MTRARFVLLSVAVVVVAFAVGLALGLSGGTSDGTASGSPPTTPAAVPTSAGPIDLPTSLYSDCRARTVPVGTGASCTSPVAGVDEVLVVKWPDAATMQADFERTQGAKPDGKCGTYSGTPASGISSTWGNGKPLACYVNSNGAAVVLWEVPEKALQLLAIRKDGDTRTAFAWWTKAITTPL